MTISVKETRKKAWWHLFYLCKREEEKHRTDFLNSIAMFKETASIEEDKIAEMREQNRNLE